MNNITKTEIESREVAYYNKKWNEIECKLFEDTVKATMARIRKISPRYFYGASLRDSNYTP